MSDSLHLDDDIKKRLVDAAKALEKELACRKEGPWRGSYVSIQSQPIAVHDAYLSSNFWDQVENVLVHLKVLTVDYLQGSYDDVQPIRIELVVKDKEHGAIDGAIFYFKANLGLTRKEQGDIERIAGPERPRLKKEASRFCKELNPSGLPADFTPNVWIQSPLISMGNDSDDVELFVENLRPIITPFFERVKAKRIGDEPVAVNFQYYLGQEGLSTTGGRFEAGFYIPNHTSPERFTKMANELQQEFQSESVNRRASDRVVAESATFDSQRMAGNQYYEEVVQEILEPFKRKLQQKCDEKVPFVISFLWHQSENMKGVWTGRFVAREAELYASP